MKRRPQTSSPTALLALACDASPRVDVVSVHSPGVSRSSLPVWIPSLWACQTLAAVSRTQAVLLDCQPFVHKDTGYSQALPATSLSEGFFFFFFAVNINIYLQSAVGILMGGLCSLLRLWNKATWCAAVRMSTAPESYVSFLKNNNYLWGSSIATLMNIIWFLLAGLILAVTQSCINCPCVNSWCCNSLFITVIRTCLFAGFEMHAFPQTPLNTSCISEIFALHT